MTLSGYLNVQDSGSTLNMGGHTLTANQLLLGWNGCSAVTVQNRGTFDVTNCTSATAWRFNIAAADTVTNFYSRRLVTRCQQQRVEPPTQQRLDRPRPRRRGASRATPTSIGQHADPGRQPDLQRQPQRAGQRLDAQHGRPQPHRQPAPARLERQLGRDPATTGARSTSPTCTSATAWRSTSPPPTRSPTSTSAAPPPRWAATCRTSTPERLDRHDHGDGERHGERQRHSGSTLNLGANTDLGGQLNVQDSGSTLNARASAHRQYPLRWARTAPRLSLTNLGQVTLNNLYVGNGTRA